METNHETHILPLANIGTALARIDAFNKRATKLGAAGITVDLGPIDWGTEDEPTRTLDLRGDLTIALPGGWRPIALVDHIDGVAHTLGDDPEAWRDAVTLDAHCDHCHLDRHRRWTITLRDETGRTAQFGLRCATDYLGVTLNLAALRDLAVEFDDIITDAHNPRFDPEGHPVGQFLAAAVHLVNADGYHRADGKSPSTGAEAMEMVENGAALTPADWAEAHAIGEWLSSLDPTEIDQYLHNVRAVVETGRVSMRRANLVASAVPSYRRAMGEARSVEMVRVIPAWDEGRQTVTVAVERLTWRETQWGSTEKMTGRDAKGRGLWVTVPKGLDVDTGDVVEMTVGVTPADEIGFGFGKRPSKARIVATPCPLGRVVPVLVGGVVSRG